MGGIHPGSVLMDKPSDGSSLIPMFVDWEFARANGHGVNADIAGFLTILRCELIILETEARLHRMKLSTTLRAHFVLLIANFPP